MITAADIYDFMGTLAPYSRAESWDNCGFQCGRKDKEVHRILIALDPFEDTAQEAVELGADLLLTHHPLLFFPITAATSETAVGRTLLLLAGNDIASISAHTNLDVAPKGVNDVLAKTLGLSDIRTAEPTPDGFGLLRCGTVDAQPLQSFLEHVKDALGTPVLRYASGGKPVQQVAVCGGAGASEWREALAAGCDTFVTSDAKYNDFWDAADAGLNLIDAGHFYTENPVCEFLKDRLQAAFPETEIVISGVHRDCMAFF